LSSFARYFSQGPQRTLYLPQPLLKISNSVVLFETDRFTNKLAFVAAADFGPLP
jgi:hypothetical protein